jgi:hypothetical protein
MAANDLCQLADAKTWLGRTDDNSDMLLSGLITRASRQILSWLQRGIILPRTVSELRDGTGTQSLTLKAWPVISIISLVIDNQTIPPSPAMTGTATPVSGTAPIFGGARGPGWMLETWDGTPPGRPQTLSLSGYSFGLAFPGARNFQNVQIVYQAGYQVTGEPQTVSGGTVTVAQPYGAWASDGGMSYATGTPLALVSASPQPGQYALGANPGVYVFNASDNGQAVLVTYGFVPSDLAQAAIELVSEMYKYSQRVGEKSHSLGGNETVAFDTSRMTPLIQSLLQPYRQILPV